MRITVIISHYKNPGVLKLALGYIQAWKVHAEENNNSVEIVVADSDTIPETKELISTTFPEVKLLTSEKNLGFSNAVNRAINNSEGEFIFIMNADVIVPSPEALDTLINHIEENRDVGIVGPALMNFDNTHQPSAFRYYTPLTIILRRTFLGKLPFGRKKSNSFVMRDRNNIMKQPTEVDWLMGSALLTKRQYLESIGLFDERFFMYMEDVDLCRRFWESGLKVVYNPRSKMYHYHGRASRSRNLIKSLFNKYTRIHIKSACKYFRKHGLRTPKHGV